MASTQFTVNGISTPGEIIVAPGSTVNLAVLSVDGLDSIEWSVEASSDENLTPPTITPAGSPSGATASFTMTSSLGVAYRILATGNGNTSSPLLWRAVAATPNHFGAAALTNDEDNARSATEGWLQTYNQSLEGKPEASGSVDTTDASTQTLATIATFDDFIYSVGVIATSRSGSNIAWQSKRFVYKNVGGTLTQVGSDVDDAANTDDITVTGLSHTDSSTNILVQWAGKASTNIRTRYFVQVYRNMLDDHP